MKTVLPLLFPAAFGAFLLSPLSFELGVSLLTAAALVGIALNDYSRRPRARAAAMVPTFREERFGLAA